MSKTPSITSFNIMNQVREKLVNPLKILQESQFTFLQNYSVQTVSPNFGRICIECRHRRTGNKNEDRLVKSFITFWYSPNNDNYTINVVYFDQNKELEDQFSSSICISTEEKIVEDVARLAVPEWLIPELNEIEMENFVENSNK